MAACGVHRHRQPDPLAARRAQGAVFAAASTLDIDLLAFGMARQVNVFDNAGQ